MKYLTIGGKKYQLVTLDFESFYGTGYTLTSMSTTDYIQDKRFKIHGCGLKIGTSKTRWISDPVALAAALACIDWTTTALVCHNTAFDGFILHEKFSIHPAFYCDTLGMARATLGHHMRLDLDTVGRALGVGGKLQGELVKTKDVRQLDELALRALGTYAINDVDVCYRAFVKLHGYMPDAELELIDLTLRMFCDPVLRLNKRRVQAELDRQVTTKAWTVSSSGAHAKALRSRLQFPLLLAQAGGTVPMKISKTTGRPTYALASTDQGFKELLRNGNPEVRKLCEAKLAVSSSIGETRPKRFLTAVLDKRKLPVALNYSGAHTHRWSGGNKMNMQNLERGGELRRSILAPVGHVLVVGDSAQIEARVVAWLAGEKQLVEAFHAKRDIYSEFASLVYKRHVDRKRKLPDGTYPDADEGFVGKTCILGLGYGMGPDRLRDTLLLGVNGPEVDLPRKQCQEIIDLYRAKYCMIPALWDHMKFVISCMAAGSTGTYKCIKYGKNFIQLPGGLFLRYPDLKMGMDGNWSYASRKGPTKIYGGLLTENIVQALARNIVATQMLEISRRYRVVLTTHDEVVCVAPRAEAKQAYQFVMDVMSKTPDWAAGLPVLAEGGYAANYSK